MARILLVEDDEIMRVTLHDRLKANNWLVDIAENGLKALNFLEKNTYHVIVSDIKMPGLNGISLLKHINKNSPDSDVILMTAYGSVENAVKCLKQGAADYMLKPFDMDDLTIRVNRLLQIQSFKIRCESLQESLPSSEIIGSGPSHNTLMEMIHKIAPTNSTIFITGESGTGKELVATAIHNQSLRADKPYIKINCGAIPEALIESELFGHEKGAFTGADTRKIGKFELADGGTLLLDEIGDLPLALQVKLLRVLQEKELERLGGHNSIKIDVRILCATAKNLTNEVKQGNFREDLYYRLQVIPIEIPPLRNRGDDIPTLCAHFLHEFSHGRSQKFSLSKSALQHLLTYSFPGNIRELKNILERATVLASSPVIEPKDLPADISGVIVPNNTDDTTLAAAVARAEKECIFNTLKKTGYNKTMTAKALGISRKNLWQKLKLYGES
ncbi:MAG: sigma-54 dependent transcriptional regulator [Desulfobulbaceae bacterium]|nr:sigma-54 dependent transcriptional regulator [Desulfobulbaceae bacterium]